MSAGKAAQQVPERKKAPSAGDEFLFVHLSECVFIFCPFEAPSAWPHLRAGISRPVHSLETWPPRAQSWPCYRPAQGRRKLPTIGRSVISGVRPATASGKSLFSLPRWARSLLGTKSATTCCWSSWAPIAEYFRPSLRRSLARSRERHLPFPHIVPHAQGARLDFLPPERSAGDAHKAARSQSLQALAEKKQTNKQPI